MGKKLSEKDITERIDYACLHNTAEFARRFGIKQNSAVIFYWEHGISTKSEKKEPKLRKLYTIKEVSAYTKEHTLREAELYFGVNYQTLYRFIKDNNIKFIQRTPGAKADKEKKDMIIHLAKTFPEASIARVFGVTRQYIHEVVNEKA